MRGHPACFRVPWEQASSKNDAKVLRFLESTKYLGRKVINFYKMQIRVDKLSAMPYKCWHFAICSLQRQGGKIKKSTEKLAYVQFLLYICSVFSSHSLWNELFSFWFYVYAHARIRYLPSVGDRKVTVSLPRSRTTIWVRKRSKKWTAF